MESWPPKLRMLAVLGATRAFVSQSPHEGWPAEDPRECAVVLDQMIARVLSPASNPIPAYSSIQFLGTGPLQEIAMANGWHDAYLNLAEAFDRLEQQLNIFSGQDA